MTFKKLLIKVFYHISYYLLLKNCSKKGPAIVYYHRVIDDDNFSFIQKGNPHIAISKALFHNQIRQLYMQANVISLDRFVNYLLNGEKLPSNSVLITFDDGYRDNYTEAFPILKKFGVPATVFLTTNMIGSTKTFWWDDLYEIVTTPGSIEWIWESAEKLNWVFPFDKADISIFTSDRNPRIREKYFTVLCERLKKLNKEEVKEIVCMLKKSVCGSKTDTSRQFLSWQEVKEMSDNGITFGSHSCTHSNLSLIKDTELLKELAVSKEVITNNTGHETISFSYPYGFFNDVCKRIAQKIGYKVGFATKRGRWRSDQFSVPRTKIKSSRSIGIAGEFSPHLFQVEYNGFMDELGMWRLTVLNVLRK